MLKKRKVLKMQISMNYDMFIEKEMDNVDMVKNLSQAKKDNQYIIKEIKTNDSELENFLFTLGCYKGEVVTLISKLAGNFVINIKDARYSIDEDLAKAIILE